MLLDTNVVSELRRGRRCATAVAAWQATVCLWDQYLSVITLLELRRGIALKARTDPVAGARLLAWYQQKLKPTYVSRLLPVTPCIAERCAGLHVPDSRAYRDSLIAATALEHGLTVVTRNVRDFDGIDELVVVNPWQYLPPDNVSTGAYPLPLSG
ncbi:MAG: type II toxin-antitoxin system VapC family toxin [Candidatus Competibacterales bacterium]